MNPTLRPLADEPEEISLVASWIHREWSERTGISSVEPFRQAVSKCTDPSRIPFAVVACLADRVVGTAALVEQDMKERSDLSPWLARVYVEAPARGQGVGSALCRDVLARAMGMGVSRLYLFTPDQQHFYSRMGWEVIEDIGYWNTTVSIMSIAPRNE